ncbi:MAG: helix-turn-helix domain-containing protein [Clostridia bacterium]|nr:helix-turn-helix domain-containing protein [Clostridia bacterium]
MYEPKNFPILDSTSALIDNMKFSVAYKNERLSSVSPGLDPIHIHGFTEIFLNINADVSFLVENRLYPLSRGDVIVSAAGSTHVCVFESDAVHEYVCLWIDADISSPLLDFITREGFSPLISLGEATDRFVQLIHDLDVSASDPALELTRAASLLGILSILSSASGIEASEPQLPRALQSVLDDIHENCTQIKSVNDIISRHFISGATLNRYFRKYIRLSPREYLESQKLSYATKLLLAGESVTDCCMHAGFSDCSHFISLFKKKFGTTPLKYKRIARL